MPLDVGGEHHFVPYLRNHLNLFGVLVDLKGRQRLVIQLNLFTHTIEERLMRRIGAM